MNNRIETTEIADLIRSNSEFRLSQFAGRACIALMKKKKKSEITINADGKELLVKLIAVDE